MLGARYHDGMASHRIFAYQHLSDVTDNRNVRTAKMKLTAVCNLEI